METVYIGLGTNVGDKLENLRAAIELIRGVMNVTCLSSIYQTAPWGYLDQEDFFNMAIEVHTELPPEALLGALKTMESDLGREKTFRYGPRSIDMDILIYGDLVYRSEALSIPHPKMIERAFVLAPLAEIAPNLLHPVMKKTISELYAFIDPTGIKRLDEINL